VKKLIKCQCGAVIRGANDDELVANVERHAQEVHGGMKIAREQILAMAEPDTQG
jgi:predicted small metal-binding protein